MDRRGGTVTPLARVLRFDGTQRVRWRGKNGAIVEASSERGARVVIVEHLKAELRIHDGGSEVVLGPSGLPVNADVRERQRVYERWVPMTEPVWLAPDDWIELVDTIDGWSIRNID
jgi:hypothetical protein